MRQINIKSMFHFHYKRRPRRVSYYHIRKYFGHIHETTSKYLFLSHTGTSSIPTRSFYSRTRASSRIEKIVMPSCNSSDEDLSEDDDIEDPTYKNPLIMPSDDELSNASEDEDTVVLQVDNVENTPKQQPNSKRRRIQHDWIRVITGQVAKPALEFQYSSQHDHTIRSPMEYFKSFITDDLINNIVEQSNQYALHKNPNKPLKLSSEEFEQWLAIAMKMSLTKISDTRLHWSSDFQTDVASVMSRTRWEEIKGHLHLVDNATVDQSDRLAKVRPLVEHLRTKFNQIPKTEHLAVDEQMVPFKGRSSIKQYIPKKPYKWGYKLFVLADHKGMVYDFFPYEGKLHPVGREGVPDLGASSNSVLILAESIPEGKNHKLYMDNWFTSIPLISHLATRGIWVCGTVQARRIPNLTFKDDKALAQSGRGSYDEYKTNIGSTWLTALKWFDNRSVCLASSFVNSANIETVSRYDKKQKEVVEIPIPQIVKQYNEHMGGVDLHDQLLSYYRMSFRSKKYYMRLVFHLFDMTVVNSWLMYRRDAESLGVPKKKQDSLLRFKFRLASSLLKAGKRNSTSKRGRPSSVENAHIAQKKIGHATRSLPEADVRLDQTGHFPEYREVRGMCKMPNCRSRILIHCEKCNVPLCMERHRNCFKKFHTE